MGKILFLISVLCYFSVNCQTQKYELVLRKSTPYIQQHLTIEQQLLEGKPILECSFNPPIPKNYTVRCLYSTELSAKWYSLPSTKSTFADAHSINRVKITADKPEKGEVMKITCDLYNEYDIFVTESNDVTVLLTGLKISSSGIENGDTKYYKFGEVVTLVCVFPVVTTFIENLLNSLEYVWYHINYDARLIVADSDNYERIIDEGTLMGIRYKTKLNVTHHFSKVYCVAMKENIVVGKSKELFLFLDADSGSNVSVVYTDKFDKTSEDDDNEKARKIWIRNYIPVLYYDAGIYIHLSCYSERVELDQRLVWYQRIQSSSPLKRISYESTTKDAGLSFVPEVEDNDTSIFCALVSKSALHGNFNKSHPIRLILNDDAVTLVKPNASTTPGPLAKNEPTDSSLLWIGVGVALLFVLLIIMAIVIYKLQKKRSVTPNVNDKPDTDHEPAYSYATAPVLNWEEAHARAANNRPLPRYQTVVPSLPPRNADQNEYEYIDPLNLRRRNPPE